MIFFVNHLRKLYILGISVLVYVSCLAQSDVNRQVNLLKIMPVSPEAASLGKFGQIPVSYYRGVPNISIPLFQLSEGEIDLPIQLSYHAGGIKVEEMASNVGLAWALNAGGVITRSQKGLDDEVGYFNNYSQVRRFIMGGLTQAEQNSFKVNTYKGYADSEPDIFYFNFGGITGKFFCSDSGKLFTSPRSDLKITYDTSTFFITDGKGIKYTFANRELTTSEPWINSGSGYANNDQDIANTAWYLTSVEDPFGNKIQFTYVNAYTYFRTKSVSNYNLQLSGVENGCNDYFSDAYNQVNVNRPVISEINFSTGKVRFEYESSTRLDAMDKALKQVSLINLSNDTVRSFRLFTGYFATNSIGGCEDGYGYRLRLDSLQEMGKSGKKVNPYKFTYNATPLPCRLSNAQDHWGYYNGVNNTVFVRYQNAENGPWVGANKEPDSNYAKAGILEMITYPTGGRTEFTYEGNVYSYSVPAGFDPTHPVVLQNLSGNNTNHGGNIIVSFQSTFTINSADLSPGGYVWATASLSKYSANPAVLNVITLQVTGNNGYNKVVNNGDSLHLAAGNYTITGTIETEYAGNPYCDFSFVLSKIPYNPLTYYNKAYGGIRIGQIRDYDDANHIADVKTYKYNAFDIPGQPSNTSSGQYSGLQDNAHYTYTKMNCSPAPASCCNFRVYNSISNYPLLYTGSSPIGYKNVTVYLGPNGTGGKQEFTFTSYSDYPDQASYTMPFYFASEYDWRKGLLLKSTEYKYQGTSYLPVRKKMTVYDFHDSDSTRKISRGVVLGKTIENGYTDSLSILSQLQVASYDVIAEAFNVSSDTSLVYDINASGNIQKIVNSYTYSPKNFQLSRKVSQSNKSESLTQNFRYALDFVASGANSNRGKSIWNLQNRNIISTPVESFGTRIKGGSEYVLFGNINSFRIDKPLIDTIYSLDERGATLLSSYQLSSVNGSNNYLFYQGYKPYIIQSRYTSKGKNAEVNRMADYRTVYLWDYNGELPVAEVVGADSSSVAYSSFETATKGNWVYTGASLTDATAPTGTKYYNLANGAITKAGLSSGVTYTVTYWRKNGTGSPTVNSITGSVVVDKNGWTLYKHQVTGITTVTVGGAGNIDELRLHPSIAQMETKTYQPLIGISSEANNVNQILYYEYDALGRLYLVRDQDRNILKRICYNYYGQAEDCAYNISAIWQANGIVRCQPCPTNNNYITNIQEHQEKDINPNSATYNTYRWVSDGVSGSCVPVANWQNTATAIRCKTISGINTGEREQEQQDMNPCSVTGGQIRWVVVDQNCTVCPKPGNWQVTGNYRCVTSGGNNTGQQEREEIDTETCSATYNQTRWVSVGANCTACAKPGNWQVTGNYRCVTSGGINTGEQEREEKDMETCSATYNQTRWVSVGTNCTACAKPASWQVTGNYRCVTSGGNNTSEREREEINTEPCSATYNQTRWVSVGTNCVTCPKPANWQATGNYRCVTSGGNNTGEQEREEKDMEPCSLTYNQTRWVSNGTNATACPTCNTSTCVGNNKRCVNNVCETGVKVYTFCEQVTHSQMRRTYHYEFSNGSWSSNFTELVSGVCPIE